MISLPEGNTLLYFWVLIHVKILYIPALPKYEVISKVNRNASVSAATTN